MKMAKASERDIEMALELSRTIEELMKGYFPAGADDDDQGVFDPSDGRDCHKAIDLLFEIACKGSLFRVVFGMAVVIDPKNEVVDPDADCLELHPKHQKAHEQRDELLDACKAMVSAQHSGPITDEMMAAWKKAGALLTKLEGGAA